MARLTEAGQNKQALPFDEAMAVTGYGCWNVLVLLATGIGLMSVIIETMGMMIIIPAAQCDLDLDLREKGLLSSVSFVGIVATSHIWGYLADTKGRRMVLIVSLGVSSLTTLVCSVVPWDWLFILLRFVNGAFIGGASSVVYAFAGEFHDNYYRPKVISFMSSFVALGTTFIPGLAWLVLPQTWRYEIPALSVEFRPWRLLLVLYALPSMVSAALFCYLPETPKFLLTQGRHGEVMDILKTMYEGNLKGRKGDFPVDAIIWDELGESGGSGKEKRGLLKSMWRQTAPLFKGELLMKTVMLCFLQFGVFAANSGISMWYPEILNRMSIYSMDKSDEEVALCKSILYEDDDDFDVALNATKAAPCKDDVKTDVFLVMVLLGMAYVAAYILIGTLINVLGKKTLMGALITITTLSGLCSQFVYGYGLIQISIGIFLLGGTAISITNAIAVDLFPTQVRAMALAVSLMFGRIGAMTGTNAVGPLFYNLCDYLFYIISMNQILIIIVVILLPSPSKLPKLIQ